MFKNIVSSALILTQISLIASATAATSGVPTATPEFKLLQNSIALAGQGLSQKELSARAAEDFDTYDRTAEADGRIERMEQALVTLGLYTPDQAQELMTDVHDFVSNMSISDAQSVNQALLSEMSVLDSKYPAGAQFSGCGLTVVFGVSGTGLSMAGAILWDQGSGNHSEAEVTAGMTMLSVGGLAIIDSFIIRHFAGYCDFV